MELIMKIGMLWFDNDPKKALSNKLELAAKYYRDKYDSVPDLCFVNPDMLTNDGVIISGMEMRTSKTMLINYFWIGCK
jgi:hypothetical protein